MDEQKLSQEEIDELTRNITSDTDYSNILQYSDSARKRRIELEASVQRYINALENNWPTVEQHRRDFHYYAHNTWLRNKGFDNKRDFQNWVVKQMKLKISKSTTEHEKQYWTAALQRYCFRKNIAT